ncbi:MAG: outer membrane beta-barrel protein [Gammaproteobacteria bacterium]|nr:outer membrane beta-barrel protein [Gammaproteobacteria bacterium]
MNKSLALLVVALAAGPSLALAGPYVGVGIGGTRMKSTLSDLSDGSESLSPGPVLPVPTPPLPDPNYTGSEDFDSTDVAFDVTAGWMFGHFGIEVGYTDFGEQKQRYQLPESCDSSGCQSREWTATMAMEGWRAFLVGSLPLTENIDGYAKLGALLWSADYAGYEREAFFVPSPPITARYSPVSFDDDDTALAAAVGVNLKTDTPFSLRVEISYYDVESTDYVLNAQLMGIYTF